MKKNILLILRSFAESLKKETRRILAGRLRGPREFTRVTILLWATAAVCFVICWMLHPASCDFSIFDDTISHFGKPGTHGNSFGFLAFHLGFATLCLYMYISIKYRDRQLRALPGSNTARATQLYTAGILGLVLSLIFPDSKLFTFIGISYRKFHGGVVVVGIFCFAGAILHDTRKLWSLFSAQKMEKKDIKNTFIPKKLRPIVLLAGIFGLGLTFMGIWEVRCYLDASLDHWPGEGIFSTALWEWIIFTYLIVFMFWYTRTLSSILVSRGGIAGVRRWRIE